MKPVIRTVLGGLVVLMSSVTAVSAAGLDRERYTARFPMQDRHSPNWPDVQACLRAWGPSQPFGDTRKLRFRVIRSSVKVFGLGGDVADDVVTDYPQLIFIQSAVNVMGKSRYRLMNPNGWYCFEDNVNVMGKAIIETACHPHLATSKGTSTTVLGKSDADEPGSVTVLGKTVIRRHCP